MRNLRPTHVLRLVPDMNLLHRPDIAVLNATGIRTMSKVFPVMLALVPLAAVLGAIVSTA